MADNADSLLRSYGRGDITFDQLTEKFSQLPPVPKRPEPTSWGEVYQQAEEGDPSISAALYRANYAGNITDAEEAKLLAAIRRKTA